MGPATRAELDALLQPSLTAEDDVVGFAAPWHPWNVVFAYFFAGPFLGGALLALNFRRLGTPRMVWPCVALCSGVGLVVTLAALWVGHSGLAETWTDNQQRLVRTVGQVLGLLPAMWMASRQNRRFRIYTSSGHDPARVLVWGLGAVALGLLVNPALTRAMAMALGWLPAEAGADG